MIGKCRVGLIGLGLMGRGIGHSLMRAGYPLHIRANQRREVAVELVAAGANERASPVEVATSCDVIVLCLPGESAVEEVLFGQGGICLADRPGLCVVECSTLTPATGQLFAERLSKFGMHFVDAPLTGGPREAITGELQALVGGSFEAAVTRSQEVLGAFCRQQYRFPGVGNGYAAKLVNNFLAFSNLVAVAEAIATATCSGLDIGTLLAAVTNAGGQSRCLSGLTPWLSGTGESRSIVTIGTAAKDLEYYCRFAEGLGTLGPSALQSSQSLQAARDHGSLSEALTPEFVRHVASMVGVRL